MRNPNVNVEDLICGKCPYMGCSHNHNGQCDSEVYLEIEHKVMYDDLQPSSDFYCEDCEIEDGYCLTCGRRLKKIPDVDEENGRLYGYSYECSSGCEIQ